MKKNLLVCVMAAAAVFTLTGCGDKKEEKKEETTTKAQEQKLVCQLAQDGDTLKYTFTFDGDKVSKVTYTATEKNKGVSANTSYSGTLVTNSLTFTVANLDEGGKSLYDEIFGEIKDKNMDGIKEQLTSNGLTCK